MVRAEAGAQREGGPEREVDAPTALAIYCCGLWDYLVLTQGWAGGMLCCHLVPPQGVAGAHLPRFLCSLPPSAARQLPAAMGVIRLEGDLGSDYLGWKLAPCVFFHPA